MHHEPSPDEWRSWLRRCGPRFHLYARQQTRTESDAEDVLQDALVESWKRTGEMPPDALVYATIRRRAIDLARSSDRRSVREVEAGTPETEWFSPNIEERETQRLLEDAVKSLQPIYREVVTLKMWGGLTFQEIAKTTGVPLNTAASRYRYALDGLRGILKGVVL
ncbi:MAG: RNA polymerase sigma factor [Chthoniobacteraceae bacterium]